MIQPLTVAVDVMGGDFGPHITMAAAKNCLLKNPALHLVLVGDEQQIQSHARTFPDSLQQRIVIQHTPEVVAMDDKPSFALRNKKNSSMGLALQAVQAGQADACVSAGNTGALMALGRSILGTHDGIERPAFISEIPSRSGHCHLLDLGANVNCTAEHLYQFAVMGSIVAEVVDGVDKPRVGLLNVGQEEIKGNEQIKLAATMLADNDHINYIGYVEGDHIFSNEAEVIVCDGFVGNVALKASEGLAKMIGGLLEESFARSLWGRLLGLLARPLIRRITRRLDIRRHNGASLLGLKGIVVKSHGNADVPGFEQAIQRACLEVEKNLPALIHEHIARV